MTHARFTTFDWWLFSFTDHRNQQADRVFFTKNKQKNERLLIPEKKKDSSSEKETIWVRNWNEPFFKWKRAWIIIMVIMMEMMMMVGKGFSMKNYQPENTWLKKWSPKRWMKASETISINGDKNVNPLLPSRQIFQFPFPWQVRSECFQPVVDFQRLPFYARLSWFHRQKVNLNWNAITSFTVSTSQSHPFLPPTFTINWASFWFFFQFLLIFIGLPI